MPQYRFGKHPPKIDYRTLRFSKYITDQLPAPPVAYSALDRVYKNLGENDPTVLFPMDGNDKWGLCTIAALAHAITIYRGFLSTKDIMAANDVLKLYMRLTRGVDSGLNELDVLNYWQSNPVENDEVIAYVRVNPKNHTHVKQAMSIFGSLYIGFQVQENAISDFENRKPWTPGELTNDGHAVVLCEFDQAGVTALTWGNTQKATWSWLEECCDEIYALIPEDAQFAQFAPGFDMPRLMRDLKLVAN